jgi:trehalose/maltose hydrolase-like predicted phosphorylase
MTSWKKVIESSMSSWILSDIDLVYTNVAAMISLNFATFVGNYIGFQTPKKWQDISAALKTPEDANLNIFLEFDGYSGKLIKQADVVLLGFPFEYPMSTSRRRSDLVYYSNRTDLY